MQSDGLVADMKSTRAVRVGNVVIGGGNPVLIQSMTNTDTCDIDETLAQIEALSTAGCEAVRCAFNNAECADAFKQIKKSIDIPLIADVHFDHELAILALTAGADKVRINPGNIGGQAELEKVVQCAKEQGKAIRVGVNSGSLEKQIQAEHGVSAKALAMSAVNSVRFVHSLGFFDVVASIKSSSVPVCVEACRMFAEQCDAPQHIGITEAGTYDNAVIKSAVGLGALLLDGIGDTVRVSITGDPVREIEAAQRILQSAGIRTFFPEVISCPTCGRTTIDVSELAKEVEAILQAEGKRITAAVMGCVVNGPGEAKHADIGIAGGGKKAALFAKGELVGTYEPGDILETFTRYIRQNF
jgi:(E)-4-hydroxy-3-methylbut-2-enyl-diphosphate synthase